MEAIVGLRYITYYSNIRLVLLRLLRTVDAQEGNSSVLNRYRHTRKVYTVSDTSVVISRLVHAFSLRILFMLVVYPF